MVRIAGAARARRRGAHRQGRSNGSPSEGRCGCCGLPSLLMGLVVLFLWVTAATTVVRQSSPATLDRLETLAVSRLHHMMSPSNASAPPREPAPPSTSPLQASALPLTPAAGQTKISFHTATQAVPPPLAVASRPHLPAPGPSRDPAPGATPHPKPQPKPDPPSLRQPAAAAPVAPAPVAAAAPKPPPSLSGDGLTWRPATVDGDAWLVYLRIQKTGSQTFWQTLHSQFDGAAWGRRAPCDKGMFCGHRCIGMVQEQFKEIMQANRIRPRSGRRLLVERRRKGKGGPRCQLVFRGHINWFDYVKGASLQGVQREKIRFLAFLREPVSRAISEYRHVTEGLVAQFGPHTYGAAWDYNFTFAPDKPLAWKRQRGGPDEWLRCAACQVGSSNRMVRFMSGLSTTGDSAPLDLGDGGRHAVELAKQHLRECKFVGIMERYAESMLVLKFTFPSGLARFRKYSTAPHPKTGHQVELSEAHRQHITAANSLDSELYSFGRALFDARFESMLAQLPSDQRNLRFRSQKGHGGGADFFLE